MILKKIIPFKVKDGIKNRFKNYFLFESDKQILEALKKNSHKSPILLSSFYKSGNTWLRFIIFNYFNIKINHSNTTLTYNELNTIQTNSLEKGQHKPFMKGFPAFYRTHYSYRKVFDYFRVIYIYRNPLDALISFYYYSKNRPVPFHVFPITERKKFIDINYFVLYNIYAWIDHYSRTENKSTIVTSYEKLLYAPFDEAFKVLSLCTEEIDKEILEKSIEISSFDSIKKMGKDVNQEYGMSKDFKGEFTRSGKTKQYLTELKAETIKKVKRIFKKKHVDVEI